MSDLPAGWSEINLGEIAEFEMGQAPPGNTCNKNGVGTVFVKAGEFGPEHPQVREWTTQPLKFAQKGDVLICVVGATAGKLNLSIDCAIGRSVAAIRPGAALRQTLLYRQLQLQVERLRADSTGTAQGVISKQMLADIKLVLPPDDEQTRIADQLDKLLARAKTCNDRLNAIPSLLKRFRQAVLRAATEGSLIDDTFEPTNGNWTKTVIGEIAEDLRYGTSKKCGYESKGKGVLRIPNIAQHGRIDVSDLKRADFDDVEIKKLSLREGDLLVIRSNGSVELVGKIGLVTTSEVGLLFAGYLIRLRVDPTKARPEFIQLWLSAPAQRQLIERTAKSTSGVNNLNAEELRSFPLSLPSLEEQDAIINRVKTLFDKANYIEAQLTNVRAHAQRLIPLLLDKAFRGELVPQDPNDEPAEALLARIAAQRANAEPKARKPRVSRAPRAPKETAAMTKSRQDDDVKDQPYLAGHLRRLGAPVTAETLFKMAELPVADFYKQLAWEVAQGYVNDSTTLLEQGHAT